MKFDGETKLLIKNGHKKFFTHIATKEEKLLCSTLSSAFVSGERALKKCTFGAGRRVNI